MPHEERGQEEMIEEKEDGRFMNKRRKRKRET